MKIAVWKSKVNAQWYVGTRYSNGRTHMTSEGYKTLQGVSKAVAPLVGCPGYKLVIQEPRVYWSHDKGQLRVRKS